MMKTRVRRLRRNINCSLMFGVLSLTFERLIPHRLNFSKHEKFVLNLTMSNLETLITF